MSAGSPGAPTLTGVAGTDGGADLTFTVAADNVAHAVRVFYSDAATEWTPLPDLLPVPEGGSSKTVSVAIGGDNGLPRGGAWRFRLAAGERRGQGGRAMVGQVGRRRCCTAGCLVMRWTLG